MNDYAVIRLIEALEAELKSTFEPHGYRVEAREPRDSDLESGTIWISNDSIKADEGIADMGVSVAVVIPVYVSIVLDPPWDVPSAYQSLRRRQDVVVAVQRVVREFAADMRVIFRGENLLARKEYEVAFVQLDVQDDLEALLEATP